MAKNFYAVRVGRVPGIYNTWDDCKKQVNKYPGAVFKGFKTRQDAEDFLRDAPSPAHGAEKESNSESVVPWAYVDGSFNPGTGVYGYGGFLVHGDTKYVFQGSGNDPEMASMRNVSGEILGSIAAVRAAIDAGFTELIIYYDYVGIEQWAKGTWKRNKAGTKAYYEFMQKAQQVLKIQFVKVKGHSGIPGNEEADRLAKDAVGCIK